MFAGSSFLLGLWLGAPDAYRTLCQQSGMSLAELDAPSNPTGWPLRYGAPLDGRHGATAAGGWSPPGAPAAVSGDTHREELCRDPMRLAVPPGAGRVGLRRFSAHAWVMEPAGSASRRWATAMCRSAGFKPDVRYGSDDLLTHVALVAHGHAAAFLPDLAWYGGAPPVPLRPLRGRHRFLFTRAISNRYARNHHGWPGVTGPDSG